MDYNALLESVKRQVKELGKEERQEAIWNIVFDLTREEALELLISLPYLLSRKYWPPEGESTSVHNILLHQIGSKLEWDIEKNT